MSGIYSNDNFEVKKTLKKFGITMTKLAEELRMSRVTLTKSKKAYSESGKCVNMKCNIFFNRMENMFLVSKERIYKEIELVNRLIENLDILQESVQVNDLEIITNGIEMINNIYKDHENLTDIDNERIDVVLKKITKLNNRYFDGQDNCYDNLVGKTVVMNKHVLDVLSGRNWIGNQIKM